MQETQVWSVGWEDTLEKEMVTPSILAWEISWTEGAGRTVIHGDTKESDKT